MPFTIKLLGADVTVGGVNKILYTAPALGAIVSNVRLVNTSGSNGTVNLYFNPSIAGPTVRILDKDKSLLASDILVVKPELIMGASDTIEATTSVAMEYVVAGMEKV